MSENHENRYQLRAAAKAFEWLRRSKPAVAAREQEKIACGVFLRNRLHVLACQKPFHNRKALQIIGSILKQAYAEKIYRRAFLGIDNISGKFIFQIFKHVALSGYSHIRITYRRHAHRCKRELGILPDKAVDIA